MFGKPFRSLLRFFDELSGTKKVVFFVAILLICVVALFVAIYIQFFYQYADTDPFMTGFVSSEKTQEEITNMKNNFEKLFQNSLLIDESQKESVDSKIIKSGYQFIKEDESFYTIDVEVPSITKVSQVATDVNTEIYNDFYSKVMSYSTQTSQHIYYTVKYQAFYKDNYLSIVIKSSLKEGNSPERVVVKAYVYDTNTDQLVSINEMLEHTNISAKKVQNAIDKEIKAADNRSKILSVEFEGVYSRDVESDDYKVENAKNFFLTDEGNLYIVYTYGDTEDTNEIDVIIV